MKKIIIKSKEEVFWQNETRVAQMQIDSIRQEMENGNKMIIILENTRKFCEEQLKALLNKGGTK